MRGLKVWYGCAQLRHASTAAWPGAFGSPTPRARAHAASASMRRARGAAREGRSGAGGPYIRLGPKLALYRTA
eukprot:scaffold45423_cov60-Phaeocystis_antarctica.AAC.3